MSLTTFLYSRDELSLLDLLSIVRSNRTVPILSLVENKRTVVLRISVRIITFSKERELCENYNYLKQKAIQNILCKQYLKAIVLSGLL